MDSIKKMICSKSKGSGDFSGLVMNYEFFNTNGTVSLGLNQISLDTGADYYFFSYFTDDFSELPADTYRVVITLTDGTVLVDQSIAIV